MELTHDELWNRLQRARTLLKTVDDPLLRSSLTLLAAPLTREDPEHLGEPIPLTELESYAVANLDAMVDAYETLYLKQP